MLTEWIPRCGRREHPFATALEQAAASSSPARAPSWSPSPSCRQKTTKKNVSDTELGWASCPSPRGWNQTRWAPSFWRRRRCCGERYARSSSTGAPAALPPLSKPVWPMRERRMQQCSSGREGDDGAPDAHGPSGEPPWWVWAGGGHRGGRRVGIRMRCM